MLGLFLNAAVLCVLVWLVARGTADISFGRMFLIALGVGVANVVAGMIVGGGYLALLASIPVLGLLIFLLMKYCCVTLQQALLVTGLYFIYQVCFAILLNVLLH
jgi:hypothetical protein